MLKIAIEGCCHGELDAIYEAIAMVEKEKQIKIDLLIICGDFQALRNQVDMDCMAVPQKHKRIGDFHKYYSGVAKAPVLTIFISGNHEASNYSQELPYGGWVAENIYYMGYASLINFAGIRIAGISGIYKEYSFRKGHFEKPPYNDEEIRSVYHTREIEVFKLLQLSSYPDIFLSHDWPRGIHKYGDEQGLLQKKKHFFTDITNNDLGSPATEKLMAILQPTFWFAAHLHVKFSAIVRHPSTGRTTRFLSLDKCVPNHDFLQVIEIPAVEGYTKKLMYDPEWLAILKSTKKFDSTEKAYVKLPNLHSNERYDYRPTMVEMENINNIFKDTGFDIPKNFTITDAPYDPNNKKREPASVTVNPQTQTFCNLLFGQDRNVEPDNTLTLPPCEGDSSNYPITSLSSHKPEDGGVQNYSNPDEIDL